MAGQYGGDAGVAGGPLPYCLEGTWGAEFIDGICPAENDLVVAKHRSSAFFGTDLDMILRSCGIRALIFTGCTTEGCVESSVRDAGFLDYFTIVARDGVQSDVAELHEASLRVMEAYRADVADAAEIVAALKSR
jgi:nicotinamidase-related amidase